MNAFTLEILRVNKIEKFILSVLVIGMLLFATMNVIWIAEQLGINITTPEMNSIIKSVRDGANLSRAFALILGVAVPGWLAAIAVSFGLSAA